MSYQSNQFFRIEQSRPSSSGAFVSDNSLNKPFAFPDNRIRVPHGTGGQQFKLLEKGYIRRINEFDDGNQKPLICRFQFNPQYINQDANFASGITHPIYQPIEQLKQPIASMTNFAVRLMFDRTWELNNRRTNIDESRIASDNPWEKNGPDQVGVLHDISALYRVIGQGISDADIQSAVTRATENLAASTLTIDSSNITPEEEERIARATGNATSFFSSDSGDVNVGNTSFILPFPVRIVFSSLYIVEGFVTNTSLEILKFNSSYVPMVASVGLSVNALYIGFAKRNTFFTHVLSKSAEERRRERLSATQAQNADVTVLRSNFNILHIQHVKQKFGSGRPDPSTIPTENSVKFGELFTSPPAELPFTIRTHNIFASPTNWVSPQTGTNRSEYSTLPAGVVAELFDSGELTQITYKWKSSLFGPFDAPIDVSNASSPESILNITAIRNFPSRRSIGNEVVVTASTSREWLKLSRPSDSSFGTITLPLSGFPESSDVTTKWLLMLEAECSVTLNGRVYQSSSFSTSFLSRSDTDRVLGGTVLFNWSPYYAQVSDAASATSGASSTRDPDPGAVYSGSLGTIAPVGPQGIPLSAQIIGLPFPI